MKKLLTYLFVTSFILALCSFDEYTLKMLSDTYSEEQLQEMQQDSIHGQTGNIALSKCHAHLNVPSGMIFLDSTQAMKLVVDYYHHDKSYYTNMLGILVPSNATCFYQIPIAFVLRYNNCGYIKEADAEEMEPGELLLKRIEAQKEANHSDSQEQNTILWGWAITPNYDKKSHTLIWADLTGDHDSPDVNMYIRYLSKDGYISLEADYPKVMQKEIRIEDLASSIQFDKGYAYTDFNEDVDNISDYYTTRTLITCESIEGSIDYLFVIIFMVILILIFIITNIFK